MIFIIGDWNAKVGSQEIPGVTGKSGLGVQNQAGQRLIRVLPRKCTGHNKHPLEDSTHGHHQMVKTEIRLIIFFAAKDGEALYSQQKKDRELTVAQIMNSLSQNSDLKKVGKTTRSFRYDLNQIPYEYTVEVRNRLKGLDLIECLMNYGWRFVTLYRRQRSRPSPWKRNAKKQMAVSGGLTNSCEKKRNKKERYKHLNAEFQRIARRDKKAFFSD